MKDNSQLSQQKYNDYLNFPKTLLCSIAFLGLYTAVYSAQNIQSVLFEKDGFGSLGFYCNAAAYLAQAIGTVFCIYFMEKIGCVKTMTIGSWMTVPFIISLIFPALKSKYSDSDNFFLAKGFVYPIMIITSMILGYGAGISQPGSGKYISDCATEKTKGFYFAFFWSFYMGS